MASNVGDVNNWMTFGQDYASRIAGSVDPRLAAIAKRISGLKTGDQISSEVTGLYQPAISAAGNIGTDVSNVGMAGMAALSGLGGSLPGGMDTSYLSDAARMTSRAGGSAALLGGVLGASARSQLAESILGQQNAVQQERFGLEDQQAAAESEKARLGADWLGYATQGQGLESTRVANLGQEAQTSKVPYEIASMVAGTRGQNISNEQAQWNLENLSPAQLAQVRADTAQTAANTRLIGTQIASAPIARRAAILDNMIKRGQITSAALDNEKTRQDLRDAGLSDADINKAIAKAKKTASYAAAG